MILFLFDFLLFISFQVDEGGQLLLQNGRTATDSLFRIQGTVGFQVDNQLIEVGTLLDTSGFDRVGNTANRAEGGIQLQAANSTGLFIRATSVSRFVTTTQRDLKLNFQLGTFIDVCNDMVRVDDLDAMIKRNVASGDDGWALLVQREHRLIAAVHLDRNIFQVQEDFDDIFLHPFERTVFVLYTGNFSLYHGCAGHG